MASILIVDDEKNVREAWARALRIDGYDVFTAADAKDAIDRCDESSFDVVILDFLMPTMNGIELLARIRKRLPLCRSIIVSGKLDQDVDTQAIKGRIQQSVETDLYLHKPVSNADLKRAVESLLAEDDPDWDVVAKRVTAARKAKVKAAKATERDLKKDLKRTRRKK